MFKLNTFFKALVLVIGSGAALVSLAQIAQEPLLTRSGSVPPNLVLMFDDSASMPAETIYQYGGTPGPLGMSGPTVANVDLAPDVNLIYYDPRVTFKPRINADGTRQALGGTGGISSFKVYWRTCEPTSTTPTSTCGSYTTTSAPLRSTAWAPPAALLATGASTSLSYPITANNSTSTYPKFKDRTDCTTSALHCTWAEERQNYANWNTYHKSRLEMVKTGLGEAFQPLGSTLRLGWGTINVINTNNRLDAGVNLYDTTVKTNFYTWLYGLGGPTAATPNRLALDKVGKYFSRKDNDGPWADTPLATGTGRNSTSASAAVTTHASCRRSYSLLVTDGYWNDSPSSTFLHPTNGNIDNTAVPAIANPNGGSFSYTPAGPYADTSSNTLADVAMKYWVTDLRTDIPNKVKAVPGVNESFWQNMSFYAVSLGLDGTLPQTPATLTNLISGSAVWPAPSGNNPTTIDDMWHATINGRGGLINAASTDALTKAIAGMLDTINKQSSSQSGVAVSTANLTAGTSKYTPGYTTVIWSGNLTARTLDANSGSEVSPTWQVESGKNATTGDPISTIGAAASRNIVVFNSTSASPKVEPFTHTRLVASGLSTGMGGTVNAALIDYLRGDPSNEQRKTGGIYRDREARLGDIVNSSPVFIKKNVNLNYQQLPTAEASSYVSYVGQKQARSEGVIFVGANDGMLHAFRESTGAEIFAFVPRAVLPNLYKLADPAYVHQYYVDGPNIETDAYWGGAWKNLVIGTTGGGVGATGSPFFGGAKAVFAIDVTNPFTNLGAPNLSASNVLWEVNPSITGFAEMGNVLTDVQAGQTTGGAWVGIFGNGAFSASGTARLFVVNLQTGALIREINTGVGNTTTKNGLGGIRVVRNASQQILGVYGGDLYGNMWKFDLSDTVPTNWSVGVNGTPLYSAGVTQPITAMPAVVPHPSGGYVVSFGTGKFFENSDISSTSSQRMYGIWDNVGFGPATTGTTLTGTGSLVQQTISAATPVTRTNPDGSTYTVDFFSVSQNAVNWVTKRGWYIDLPNSGQRVVYPVEVIASPFIAIDTISPANTVSTDPCVATGQGAGWLYFISALTGAGPSEAILDTNGDNIINGSDLVVSGINTVADGRNTTLRVDAQSDATRTTFVTVSGGSSSGTTTVFTCQLLGTCNGGGGGTSPRIKTREWRQLFMR